MDAKGILMHIDRPDEVAVASKATLAANPSSAFGLVLVPTSRTPATGSSFGAGEARDAGLRGLVSQVVDILAVFPQGHAPVVVAAGILVAHAVRVADEERADLVFHAEVDHLAARLVTEIAHAPLYPPAYLVLGALELLPAAGMFGTPGLLPGDLSDLLRSPSFERADAAPGHDQGFPGIGADSGKVYLAQINRRLYRAGSLCRLFRLDADVQLEAVVPHEGTGPSIVRERNRQHDGRSPSPHRQDDTALLQGHRLRGPVDWVEALLTPGVLHAHLRVLPAEFAGGFNVGEKGVHDHLHRLAVQGIPPFGRLLQLVAPRPAGVAHPGLFVQGDAQVPDLCRFHLHLSEVLEEGWREMIEPIDMYGFHRQVFFLCARTMVTYRARRRKMSGVAFIPSAFPGRDFPLLC
ncbi:MAG: hypothetical protein AUI01_12740 [Ktedonobacter sp. 13_2_20CM_2_56_8]|nr:MAG: hypothetical protein AUH05_04265 [Ktedonobacter sp. 13_2_20CM_53_11]OLB52964.1 MAG: hypothetical protein AUI01_12740 [Ktedonobacter sp. 13_2_20CM_2_56_8]